MFRGLVMSLLVPVMGLWREAERVARERLVADMEERNKRAQWEREEVARVLIRTLGSRLREEVQAALASAPPRGVDAEGLGKVIRAELRAALEADLTRRADELFAADVKAHGEPVANTRKRMAARLRHPVDFADAVAKSVFHMVIFSPQIQVSRTVDPLGTAPAPGGKASD